MPGIDQKPQDPTDALLASILSAFGTKPPKAPKATSPKKLPRNAKPLTFTESFNELKTGYRVWTARAKAILLEEQTCACCGSKTTAVKDEQYVLENALSHSIWYRHEGYGVVEPEALPIEFIQLEPRTVSFCAVCASKPLDTAIAALLSPQLSLPL